MKLSPYAVGSALTASSLRIELNSNSVGVLRTRELVVSMKINPESPFWSGKES